MFRVKTSQANTVNFAKRPVFLVGNDAESQGVFVCEKVKKGKSEKVWLLALVLVFITGCGGSRRGGSALSDTPGDRPVRTVTDDLGRQVTVPVNVRRVVSTAPSVTENIFAVGAGDRLVGVTTFCNYPEEARSIAKIGDTMNPNMETIVGLKPDIVFVSTASQIEAFFKTLEQNGIAVYVMNPSQPKDIYKNLLALGDIFGTERTGVDLVEKLKAREVAVRQKVDSVDLEKRVTVFVQISKEPLFTVGGGTFIGGIVEMAGGALRTDQIKEAFPKLSKETALALQPEAIILSDSEDNQEPNDAFKNSPAVKNGRVYKVNADILSRPGPRLIDALEQVARFLHPEKFENR